jgi:hypothetical protein
VLHPPRAAAAHWLPGRAVSFTVYAFDIPDIHVPAATMGFAVVVKEHMASEEA